MITILLEHAFHACPTELHYQIPSKGGGAFIHLWLNYYVRIEAAFSQQRKKRPSGHVQAQLLPNASISV